MNGEREQAIPIVIDNGSETVRAGFAGGVPRVEFPNIVGTPKFTGLMIGNVKAWHAGREAQHLRPLLKIKRPVEDGIVTNWDAMEKTLHHILFNELTANPEEHPVLITESPVNPKANREKMTHILFETFQIPSLYLASCQVLSLFSQGCTTGVAVDSGSMSTYAVPVFKGQYNKDSIVHISAGGRDLTSYMLNLLTERGYSFCCIGDEVFAKDIKEKLSYIALDFGIKLSLPETLQMYELPDGQRIKVGRECFRVAEPIFNTFLIGLEVGGIHVAINNSIESSDLDIRKYLYNNIVLAGGNTMFPGYSERLHREISQLAPNVSIKVKAPPERRNSAWMGGSMLASMDSFENMTVLQSEYCEYGAAIVHRKCI